MVIHPSIMSAAKYPEKGSPESLEAGAPDSNHGVAEGISETAGSQALHRQLRGREIQLYAIGGAIGTCMCDISRPCIAQD